MDRNIGECNLKIALCVALLAEGVDRNALIAMGIDIIKKSPSSRRAWIEIFGTSSQICSARVALLAEGVDRNGKVLDAATDVRLSPSSRRAWIEIFARLLPPARPASPSSRRAWIEIAMLLPCIMPDHVALLAEGVDRNPFVAASMASNLRRPPRGGRG